MGNHIPFLVLKSGNISRKFVTKKMRSCDKNFGQLHEDTTVEIAKESVDVKTKDFTVDATGNVKIKGAGNGVNIGG